MPYSMESSCTCLSYHFSILDIVIKIIVLPGSITWSLHCRSEVFSTNSGLKRSWLICPYKISSFVLWLVLQVNYLLTMRWKVITILQLATTWPNEHFDLQVCVSTTNRNFPRRIGHKERSNLSCISIYSCSIRINWSRYWSPRVFAV